MALITLQEYKDYYKINSTTDDIRLQLLVDLVSELVQSYLSREIEQATYTEVPHELLGYFIYLKTFPVSAVTLLEFYEEEAADWVEIGSTAYVLEEENGIIEIIDNSIISRVSTARSKPIRVTFDAGYDAVPSDLKLAVFDLITYYYKREQAPIRSMGGQLTDSSDAITGSEMPPHIKRVLALYRVPA